MKLPSSKITRGWVVGNALVGAVLWVWPGVSESASASPVGVPAAESMSDRVVSVVSVAGSLQSSGAPSGDDRAYARQALFVPEIGRTPKLGGFGEVAVRAQKGWNAEGGAGGVMAVLALGALGWAFRRQHPFPRVAAGADFASDPAVVVAPSFGERREAIEFLETSCAASAGEVRAGEWIYGLGAVENLADINRTLGWAGGDAVVAEAAQHLRALEPAAACVLRISGNRLCVAVWSRSFQDAAAWFATARKSVADATVPPTELAFGLTYRRPEEPVGGLLERLDYLLLDARRSGVMWVSADMQTRAPQPFDEWPDRDAIDGVGAANSRCPGVSKTS